MTSNGKNPFKYNLSEDDATGEPDAKELSDLGDGILMYKVRKAHKCFPRLFKLDLDNKRINYSPTQKIIPCLRTPPYVDLLEAIEVRKGWKTDNFYSIEKVVRDHWLAGQAYPRSVKEENCFSIIFPSESRTVDLIAPSKEMRNKWVKVIQHILSGAKKFSDENSNEETLKEAFYKFDLDKKGSLNLNQVALLLESIDIIISEAHLETLFKSCDTVKGRKEKKKECRLDWNEFQTLMDQLTARSEISDIFNQHSNQGAMGAKDLQKFLREEQKEEKTLEECDQLIEKYGTPSGGRKIMTSKGLERLLKNANIFDERHLEVCQDMNQPLSHYFIASSHNTYLTSNQLTGSSSIEAYVRVLKSGCRCIELDLWDGDKNEPIIYHGYTLTSKILLRDVLEVIYDHAFDASKYPVILSLENHLSIEQQKIAADYFQGFLGDMLLTEPLAENEENWPSPEQLAYKIILKGKKLSPDGETVDGLSRETSIAETPSGYDPGTNYGGGDIYTDRGNVFKLKIPPKKFIKNLKDYSDRAMDGIDEDAQEEALLDGDAINLFDNQDDVVDDHCVKVGEEREAPQSGDNSSQSGSDSSEEEYYTAPSSVLPSPETPPGSHPFSVGVPLSETPKDDKTLKESDSVPTGGAEEVKSSDAKYGPSEPSISPMSPFSPHSAKSTPPKAPKLARELSDITIYCQARHFRSFDESKSWKFYEMASFEERKAADLISSDSGSFLNYNLRNLSRIYPKGTRTNSSNYQPNIYWSVGCHMVALNYQTPDKSRRTNSALFDLNGRCGYVLKPEYLRKPSPNDLPSSNLSEETPKIETPKVETLKVETLKVTVISGQTLIQKPKIKEETPSEPMSPNEPVSARPSVPTLALASSNIPDPYVTLKLFGIPNENQKFKTKYVKNNVFNPKWNQSFEFTIKRHEMAFIQFGVKDYQNGNKLGEAMIQLIGVCEGYRHVNLKDETGNIIRNSTLFVHIEKL